MCILTAVATANIMFVLDQVRNTPTSCKLIGNVLEFLSFVNYEKTFDSVYQHEKNEEYICLCKHE